MMVSVKRILVMASLLCAPLANLRADESASLSLRATVYSGWTSYSYRIQRCTALPTTGETCVDLGKSSSYSEADIAKMVDGYRYWQPIGFWTKSLVFVGSVAHGLLGGAVTAAALTSQVRQLTDGGFRFIQGAATTAGAYVAGRDMVIGYAVTYVINSLTYQEEQVDSTSRVFFQRVLDLKNAPKKSFVIPASQAESDAIDGMLRRFL